MTRNIAPKYKFILGPEDITSNVIEYETKKNLIKWLINCFETIIDQKRKQKTIFLKIE